MKSDIAIKLCAVVVCLLIDLIPTASHANQPSYSIDSFLDSMGINGNPFGLTYQLGTQGRRPAYTVDDFFELGIRHYRAVLKNDLTPPNQPQLMADAYKKYGAQAMMLLDPRKTGTPADMVHLLDQYPAGVIDIVEGPNEVNNKFPPQDLNLKYGNKVDEAAGAAFCRDYYSMLRSDHKLDKVDFASFTAIFTDYQDAKPFDSFDLGNIHSYQSEGVPESSLLANIRDIYNIYSPGETIKPIIASECGYAVFEDEKVEGRVSLRAQAKSIPMLFAEYFRNGIKRAYLFSIDDDDGYGLEDFHGNKRPSYFGLKAFVALLRSRDNAAELPVNEISTSRHVLLFQIIGAPSTVHTLCLDNGAGAYSILIWNELPMEYPRTHTDIINPSIPVTLRFSQIMVPSADFSTQSQDGSSFSTQSLAITNNSITIPVSDSVSILRVKLSRQSDYSNSNYLLMLKASAVSNAQQNCVCLDWTPSKTQKTAGYFLFRNGEFVKDFDSKACSYTDADPLVIPGLGYRYTIQSYDKNGNITGIAQALAKTPALFPDLTPVTISTIPQSPNVGDKVVFIAHVRNIGSGPTPNSTVITATFSVDGKMVSWGGVHSIAVGTSAEICADGGPEGTKYWTAESGAHTVSVNVDNLDAIPCESDKHNNNYEQIITIAKE